MIVDEVSARLWHNSVYQSDKPDDRRELALRIQKLTRSLSIPTSWGTVEETNQPSLDDCVHSIPPSLPTDDEDLVATLSDAAFMNGASDALSVWNLLDDMGRLNDVDEFPDLMLPDSLEGGNSYDTLVSAFDVMVYTPLLPVADSQVELADHKTLIQTTVASSPAACPEFLPSTWSWTCLSHLLPSWLISPLTRRNAAQFTKSLNPGWIPSKDKLSFHCTWWGYRMFLPPPVLGTLNNSEIKMIQRATLITRALVWFFNNIPIYSLPPAFRPTLFLLQRLVPFLGYIGTFISWSWAFIRNFDKGDGVILSATWIVPIALIPSTWEERDWPTKRVKVEN